MQLSYGSTLRKSLQKLAVNVHRLQDWYLMSERTS